MLSEYQQVDDSTLAARHQVRPYVTPSHGKEGKNTTHSSQPSKGKQGQNLDHMEDLKANL